MIFAQQGTTFQAVLVGADTGLLGTLGLTVIDPPDTVVQARSTDGIIMASTAPVAYVATRTAPVAREEIYLVVWDAPDGTTGIEELSVSVDPPEQQTSNTRPSIKDIGNLLPSRTREKGSFGSLALTFNELTEPTAIDVQGLIDRYTMRVVNALGGTIPVQFYKDVQLLVSLRVAMAVERGYYGGEIESGRSPYEELKEEYDDDLEGLRSRIFGVLVGDDDPLNDPTSDEYIARAKFGGFGVPLVRKRMGL